MLQILKDTTIEDKNRDLFIKSLIRECELQGVEYKVKTQIYANIPTDIPTVITEPYTFSKPLIYNNADLDTTAHVVFDLIKDKQPCEVLLIGRGNVGRRIIDLIIDHSNHTLSVANSHTEEWYLDKLIQDADIIINTSTSEINHKWYIYGKTIIDLNNNFKYVPAHGKKPNKLYNMRDIGKSTVSKIVERAR